MIPYGVRPIGELSHSELLEEAAWFLVYIGNNFRIVAPQHQARVRALGEAVSRLAENLAPEATAPGATACDACAALVNAYRAGAERGDHVDWSDVDAAHVLARRALGLPARDGGVS